MAYYDALIAKWATVTGTTSEKLSSINALTVAGPTQFVARGLLSRHFDTLTDANGVPVWEAIEQHQNDTTALGVACRAALRLRDAPGDYPAIDVTTLPVTAQLTELVTANILTSDQQAQTVALGSTTIPWWRSAGYSSPINEVDLAAAGLS
jgi:hypothetical protein